jgi:hypothetical protein
MIGTFPHFDTAPTVKVPAAPASRADFWRSPDRKCRFDWCAEIQSREPSVFEERQED